MLGWPNINPCPMLSTTKDRTNQGVDNFGPVEKLPWKTMKEVFRDEKNPMSNV